MELSVYEDCTPHVGYYVHRQCTPSWEIEEDVIEFIDLTYVVRGRAIYLIDHKEHVASAGELLCIPKGSLRSATGLATGEDLMECHAINFSVLGQQGQDMPLPFPLISKIGLHPDIIGLFRDLNAEWLRRSPGYRMKVRAITLLILQRFFELVVYENDSAKIDGHVKKAMRYIADNYASPVTIGDLARLTGLNQVYMGSLFKKFAGVTFRRYLMDIRLNRAEDMLKSGEYSVSEVASLCGFSDIYYFSRAFKESRGVSPSRLSVG